MRLKTFTVDYDSIDELTRMISVLKSRAGELRCSSGQMLSKKERSRSILSACEVIWNTDLSAIYQNQELSSEPKFYIYAHLDTTKKITVGCSPISTFAAVLGMDHLPFYIGKGTGRRVLELDRNETHRKVCQKIRTFGYEPKVTILKDGISEFEALSGEAKLIDIFGLIPHKGMLCNLDEGCDASGRRTLYKDSYNILRSINQKMVA